MHLPGKGIAAGKVHPLAFRENAVARHRPLLVIPTRISYLALLATTTYAALLEESRMRTIKATDLHRKSGGPELRRRGVEGRAVVPSTTDLQEADASSFAQTFDQGLGR